MQETAPAPEAMRVRQPSRIREVLRVAATLKRPHEAREIILEWLENEAKTDLPEPAWKGRAFHHLANERVFTAVRADEEAADTWALRFVEPEDSPTQRVWTIEVVIRERPERPSQISLRGLVSSPELKLRIQPAVPRFMEHVAAECELQQGITKIEKDPWLIQSAYDAGNLTEYLVDPARLTPAFVLTVPEESENPHEPLLDPFPLALDTLGIAKVIVLPAEHTWHLTNRFGKRLSVYRGAMRVYLPGFRDDADPEGGHDLFMPHRMDTHETASKLGTLLRWIAARESLRRFRLDHDAFSFASVLMPSIDSESARLDEEGASESARLEVSKQHVAILREELKLSMEIQQWLTEENKTVESRVRESESKLRGMQNRNRMYPDRGRMYPDRRPPPRPRPRHMPPSDGYDY